MTVAVTTVDLARIQFATTSHYVFRRRLGGEQATPSAGADAVAALPEPPAV